MSRYVARPAPKAATRDWADVGEWDAPVVERMTVSSGPVDTGLLDARGNPIYRLPEAIGFLPRRES